MAILLNPADGACSAQNTIFLYALLQVDAVQDKFLQIS
jgi:hypothetical protein